MRQLVQDLRSGAVRVVEVPAPVLRPGGVLVRTRYSVISVGTERAKVEFARKSLLEKALARPDRVQTVLETIAREGLGAAYHKVRSRLGGYAPLGYSSAGAVEAVPDGVAQFRPGQHVACAGAGFANHAERIWVPRNLVVPVPDGVPLEFAAFATLGAIALHGVRQADVRLGESVAVIGLGIIGQLTVQLLRAAAARPIGIDLDRTRVELAERQGLLGVVRHDDVVGRITELTGGLGADAVIITAAGSDDDPVRLAGELARDRGRIVIVGDVPIRVPRAPYYKKELEIRLSRSYGPGRYDPGYEEKGHDYPVGYVRWTEKRNLAEFLRLLESGSVSVAPLITHRFPFEEAERAYELLTGENGREALGVVLEYPREPEPEPTRISVRVVAPRRIGRPRPRIGLVGAGHFATGTLLPILKRLDVDLRGVVTASGMSARAAAERYGFAYAASSTEELFADPEIDAILIATRHGEHASLAAAALRAGKAVFVEKPLALDEESLENVLRAAVEGGGLLIVGFNRRFARATMFLRERLARTAGARVVHVRANAGSLPAESWVHDPAVGGGRLIGEGCHFIDLALYLAGSAAVEVYATAVGGSDPDAALLDNVQVSLRCADGSMASVLYTARGNPRSGKERVEVFAGGATGIIDDFRRAEFWGIRRERWKGTQDKGHAAELRAFVACLQNGGPAPIPLEELGTSSRVTLRAARSLTTGRPEVLTS